ncbi:hypothetical protein [Roseicella frigidaeris]|uniref:Uncharacterized protein n=1 Tax=Roseicella frigidaeris TaxID=2230885 RepID=A0A327M4Y4_9PROT|nr:hypothetical protein [Roseicella frigidaeris]RAI57465.1 hypothetical protein DOO78_18965 [Roseicella frigidaeris]
MSDDRHAQDPQPRQGYIPRPPSQADLDLVSGQQALIEDEWSGEPPKPAARPMPDSEPPPG